MNKERIINKGKEALARCKCFLVEVKTHFIPDAGASGVMKYTSRFVNLWKSGYAGRVAIIVTSVLSVMVISSMFCGGDDSSKADSKERSEAVASQDDGYDGSDTLKVKGLYMRQSGDRALEACQKMVKSFDNLIVIDLRNGIPYQKKSMRLRSVNMTRSMPR